MGRLAPGWTVQQATAQLDTISPDLFRSTLPSNYPAVSVPKYLGFKLAAYDAGSGDLAAARALRVAAVAAARDGGARSPDRVREPRQPAARPGERAPARDGRAPGPWRLARPRRPAAAHREPAARGAGAACGAFLAGTLSTTLVSFITTADETVVLDLGLDWRVLGLHRRARDRHVRALRPRPRPEGDAYRRGQRPQDQRPRPDAPAASASALRRALVVCQVALSLVLLVGAFLFAPSLQNLLNVDPGFRVDGVIVAGIDMRQLGLPRGRPRPGAAGPPRPPRGTAGHRLGRSGVDRSRSAAAPGERRLDRRRRFAQGVDAAFNQASSGYFSTLRIPMLAGRDFDDALDTPSAPLVAIVNEAFAREMLNGGHPDRHALHHRIDAVDAGANVPRHRARPRREVFDPARTGRRGRVSRGVAGGQPGQFRAGRRAVEPPAGDA